jgi:hypothetical protein
MTDRSNIYINKNTDFQTPLSFYDDDGPIDMSNYSFFGQIRKVYSEKVIAEFQFRLIDLENGEVELFLPNEVTRTLSEGKYQYDILIQHETGEITKVLEGLVFIMSTVTEIETSAEED